MLPVSATADGSITRMPLLRPGSFPWLLLHDVRIGWRGVTAMLGEAGPGRVAAILIAGALVMHALAWPVAGWLSPFVHGGAARTPLVTVLLCTFAWLLAQALFSASRTLYSRGDLDLLLGSPLPPHRVFAAKAASIAAGSFGSVALLVLPIANMGALVDRPAWLGLYPALAGLAMIATALGLALTIALFTLMGPRRARIWTQMTGAVIAGAFVLGVQIAAVLPARLRDAVTGWVEGVAAEESALVSLLRLPLDSMRGDVGASLALVALALASLAAATRLLGRRFADASVAAAGASAGVDVGRAARPLRFRGGLAGNLRRKEWRLLVRDPGMFAQLSLQIIYTIPIAIILLRNESLPPVLALAPTIVVVAAQIAASLAWLTVSGEDAPELIATAPVTTAAVDRAKLTSIAMPVSAILALPIAALALISSEAALLTAVLAAAAAASTALLNFWHPMPGNRRGMLRRHSQSKLIALLEHGLALLWAITIILAVLGSPLAFLPVVLVIGTLVLVRRGAGRVQ